MLFLAVFAGFFAENQREHYVERQRAKAYAASMLSDLRSDTVELKNYISYTSYATHNIDTLLDLLSNQRSRKMNYILGILSWRQF